MSPSVALVTLGCARNEVDSDQVTALLSGHGYTLAPEPAEADVVLVNTCTFIDAASRESVDTVLDVCDLKQGDVRAVVVVGCLAERHGRDLADALPEADAVVGFGGYARLPDVIDALLRGEQVPRFVGASAAPRGGTLPLAGGRSGAEAAASPPVELVPPSGPRHPLRTAPERPWAYLKIASGCDRACTFCGIPSWRGGFRSRTLEEITAEARWLAARGARELVLVSENTTSWGKDLPGGRSLQRRLLEELAGLPGVERIRLVYLQPDELRADLVAAMLEVDAVAPYFDLSLQHVSPPLLRAMARSGSRERFTELVAGIRSREPEAVFRSNFIVGFPGETDEDVEQLAGFLEDARLDWVGLFPYSPQEGTAAPGLPGQVAPGRAEARLRMLSEVQEIVAEDAARRFVGRRLDVIVEACGDDGAAGRSYREAPETDGEIALVAPEERGWIPVTLPAGRIVTAQVVEAMGVDLLAVPELPPTGDTGDLVLTERL